MTGITSTADLQEGTTYVLPDGAQVVAERPAAGADWVLRAHAPERVYVIVADASLRLISKADAQGQPHNLADEQGNMGELTDFTVGDLQPVEQ